MTDAVKIFRKASNSSQISGGSEDRYTARKVSISKASNLTVALSGGVTKSKYGTLKRKSSSIFPTFREVYVSVDDGDISFQLSEDDVEEREIYSLLDIREIKLLASGGSQFQLKIAERALPAMSNTSSNQNSHPSTTFSELSGTLKELSSNLKVRHVVLKSSSNKEALEWIATIKHELKNQVLVCKSMYSTLQSEGHQERAEPLFQQILELLKVIYDGKEHFEVADTLRFYGKWLSEQGRKDEAIHMKKMAKAIKRRCEEGLDISLSRDEVSNLEKRKMSSPKLPPLMQRG